MKRDNALRIFGLLVGLGVLAGLALAAAGEDGEQNVKPAAFELKMRILEGARQGAAAPSKPVTSSYLKFLTFANFEDEQDIQTDAGIKKVFSLKDLSLLTEANLVWMRGEKADKAFHMFRLNGQEYAVFVTPGKVPSRNQFRIEVYEQGADKKSNLLDSEFSLPDKTAAVFGFENSQGKPYFITLRVERWVGEPAGAEKPVGQALGGVVPGLLKSGEKVKPPKLIKEVEPIYPEEARKAGLEGVVIMEATTDTYGRVVSIKVLRSIPKLDQAAIDAVKQWVYEPMVIDGKPREVTFTVTVRFALDDKKKPEVSGVVGGVVGGVAGGVEGGVKGGVEGGVVGGVLDPQAQKKFQGDAVRAAGKIQPPKLIKQVSPVYPDAARKAGIEGVIIVEAKADEQGNVVDARILRSIPALDQAALDAVKQWKYEPMMIEGKPRAVLFTVTVRFAFKEKDYEKAAGEFAAGAVKAEGDIKPPRLVKEVAPVYPEIARQAGVEGVVILSVKADETGQVADAMVLRSIPLLDQAAIDAVKQWVYEPFVKDGKAQPIVFTVTVRFQLKDKPVKPGDTLDVQVEGLPDLNGSFRVSPEGYIDYPLLGEVSVAALDAAAIEELLAQELNKKYTKDAHVKVALKKN